MSEAKEDAKSNEHTKQTKGIKSQMKPNDSLINSTPVADSSEEQKRNLSKIRELKQEITDNITHIAMLKRENAGMNIQLGR